MQKTTDGGETVNFDSIQANREKLVRVFSFPAEMEDKKYNPAWYAPLRAIVVHTQETFAAGNTLLLLIINHLSLRKPVCAAHYQAERPM